MRAALVDAEPRLRRQIVYAPAHAVIFQCAAHPVVGHRARLQFDAAACATLSAAGADSVIVALRALARGRTIEDRRAGIMGFIEQLTASRAL